MAEYIESICRRCFHSYVCEQFNEHRDSNNEKCHFFNDHFVPAADVVPVVHGRWINPTVPKRYGGGLLCSACRKSADWTYNYCPNCGARMDEEG